VEGREELSLLILKGGIPALALAAPASCRSARFLREEAWFRAQPVSPLRMNISAAGPGVWGCPPVLLTSGERQRARTEPTNCETLFIRGGRFSENRALVSVV